MAGWVDEHLPGTFNRGKHANKELRDLQDSFEKGGVTAASFECVKCSTLDSRKLGATLCLHQWLGVRGDRENSSK